MWLWLGCVQSLPNWHLSSGVPCCWCDMRRLLYSALNLGNWAGGVLWMIRLATSGPQHRQGRAPPCLPHSASLSYLRVAALFPRKEGSSTEQRRSTESHQPIPKPTRQVFSSSQWGLKRNEKSRSLRFTGSSLPSAQEFGFRLDYSSRWGFWPH